MIIPDACSLLRSKCSTKLLFQAAYQRVAKRSEMKWLRPESSVLATRMANDRLEHFALVERTLAVGQPWPFLVPGQFGELPVQRRRRQRAPFSSFREGMKAR